ALQIPDTVHAVIRARVDRLDPESREVLRLASVIGREFDRGVLERLFLARERLAASLETLARQDLVHQVRVVPEAAYIFKHVLTQAVVYDTLLLSQRKELHAKVGAIIEALYADRLEEHYEALVHHYGNSADAGKAIQYLELAGDKATRLFSLTDARKHYRTAIDLLDDTEGQPERQRKRIDLALKLAAASTYAPSEEQVRILETSLEHARQLGDETRAARATYWIGRTHYILGNMVKALPLFERCIEMAEHLGDEELLALPYNIIGRSCLVTAEYSKGIEYLERGIPMAERLGLLDDSIYSTAYLGTIYGITGDFTRGIHTIEKALDKAASSGNLTRQAHALMQLANVQMIRGSWNESLSAATRGYEIAHKIGDVILAGITLINKGYCLYYLGNLEKGIELLRDGIHRVETTGSSLILTISYALLSEAHAVAGNREDAVNCGKKALELSQFGGKVGESWMYGALATAAALESPPDWETVHEHIGQSHRLATERGERPMLALTHFRHAEILHKKGDLDAAREQLDQAEALFRDMGMDWWSEQAEGLRGRIDSGAPFVWFAPYVDGPPTVAGE
ncbi:MAG: hypothetical protein IID61_17150, partial [SAR324 cluster bacterium]|nr:hypothetical protein [SAR324 cluster bacterium]